VMIVEGDWFGALPAELAGAVDLIVTNPPYVAAGAELPIEVSQWEPVDALIAGPTGLEEIARIVREAPAWLRPTGALVVEIGETQGDDVCALARGAGFVTAEIRCDLAARPRALLAHDGVLGDDAP
jgi:release factor glutamine methyltransferase